MVEHESKSINETLRDALLEDYRARPFLPDLVHVEHDDRLTSEQAAAVVSGDWDEVDNDDFTEWMAEATVGAAREIIKETAGDILRRMITDGTLDEDEDPDVIADVFEWTTEWDEVRFWLEDHDPSDPLRTLAQRTPDPLVQWVPESTIELDVEDEEGSAQEVTVALDEVGLSCSQHNVEAMYAAMAECHGPTEVRVLFTADLSELLDPSVTEVRLKDPTLLLLNPYDGSGMDTANMRGTITVPRNEIRLDSALGYGSWDNIAGVVTSAYTVDTEYVRLCRYVRAGHDTDGTEWFKCIEHDDPQPSPDAHCSEAKEPAYAVLLEDKEGN